MRGPDRLYERTFGKADAMMRKAVLFFALLVGWLGFMVWAQREQTQLHRLHAAQRATVFSMIEGVLYMRAPIEDEED